MNKDRFQYKIANGIDKPAIWFRIHEREVLIFPLNLYNALWGDYSQFLFSKEIKASFRIFKDSVYGSFHDDIFGYYYINFAKDCFIDSAIQTLHDLSDAILRGEETAYGKYKKNTAEHLKTGLLDLENKRKNDEGVTIEHFSFKFIEAYCCDTDYVISIGNRSLTTPISNWSTIFNWIRSSIENFIFSNEGPNDVNIYFEDSPTIIRFRSQFKDENSKKRCVRLEIIPNTFVCEPNIYGICETREVISSLYLGLLELCITETDYFDDVNISTTWEDFRLATYNKLQSCIIENFIMGVEESETSCLPRQRILNTVEEMLEDYHRLKATLTVNNFSKI